MYYIMSEEKYNYEEIVDDEIKADIGINSESESESERLNEEIDPKMVEMKKISQKKIDDLTLKLLTNIGRFNKYMSLSDHGNIEEENRRELETKKYHFRDRILGYTEQLIDNINVAANSEIRDNFNTYVYSVIKHLEYDTALLEGEDVVKEECYDGYSGSRKYNYSDNSFFRKRGRF